MEWVTDQNDHPPVATPSSSNIKDPHASGTRIDQIAGQMQQLSQRLSKRSCQFSDNGHQADLDKPMTYKDVADMLTKIRDEGRLRKKGSCQSIHLKWIWFSILLSTSLQPSSLTWAKVLLMST